MSARRAVVAVVVIVILVITLTPALGRPSEPFSACIGCGPRWLADSVLNLWLFIPLGVVLGWNRQPPATAILWGVLLSSAIELLQTVVPGRDPSLSDIVFNSLGTTVGVWAARRPYAWLVPAPNNSIVLTTLSLVTVASIMTATAVLLSPVGSSANISRSGDDLMLSYTTRASRLRLDEPEYWLPKLSRRAPRDEGLISIRRDRSRWQIDIGATSPAILGPTVGQGWTLLAYPNAIARRWGRVLDALWIAALCLPIGFWARAQLLPIAAVVVALLLALIPAVTGVVGTTAVEWAGAGVGLVAGSMIRSLSSQVLRRAFANRTAG